MRKQFERAAFGLVMILLLGGLPKLALAQNNSFSFGASLGPAYFPLTKTRDYIRGYKNGSGEFTKSPMTFTGGAVLAYDVTPNLSVVMDGQVSIIEQEYLLNAGMTRGGLAAWQFRSIPVSAMIRYVVKEETFGLTPFVGLGVSYVFLNLRQNSDFAAEEGEETKIEFPSQNKNTTDFNFLLSGGLRADLAPNVGIVAEARYARPTAPPTLQAYEVSWDVRRTNMPVDFSAVSITLSIIWKL